MTSSKYGLHCFHCGKTIFSQHVHDFVSCDCDESKSISVDGGSSYFRVLVGKHADYEVVHIDDLKDKGDKQ